MSICKDCFHSYVCEQFNEHRECDNKKCHFHNDHFVPNADVVKVVRCENCKHWGGITFGNICRRWTGLNVKNCTKPTDFCSYGELKGCEGK